ncbi:hypothetical protein NERG_02517 [Nematocida ausubeli]|uniref:Fork-head domain-containing protein n=1 Tax=Nematocida ausubeli (strain ATCC PRA-371 / ERTm2) TaxID=1913371 RepID=H8ZFZ6_NEMA1|nr:hypothetical protein NERG_02517 [Nematocida ausubeli]
MQPTAVRSTRTRNTAHTYATLIARSIESSAHGMCTLAEVLQYAQMHYPGICADNSANWQNSIRQVLSRDTRFIKLARSESKRASEWIYFPPPPEPTEKPLSHLREIRRALAQKGIYKEFVYKEAQGSTEKDEHSWGL